MCTGPCSVVLIMSGRGAGLLQVAVSAKDQIFGLFSEGIGGTGTEFAAGLGSGLAGLGAALIDPRESAGLED